MDGIPKLSRANGHRPRQLELVEPAVSVGVLTGGKPTLAMTLSGLLLQETCPLRIFVVDTSGERAAIHRDDVVYAMRLAIDRGIPCEYEVLTARDRLFSRGRRRLVEELDSPYLCLMDDDVVFSSATLARMASIAKQRSEFGYVAAHCRNAGIPAVALPRPGTYSPGSLIYQDALVRQILLDYYATTSDVLDQARGERRVWEVAFLTELFTALGRESPLDPTIVTYHLDYHEQPNWEVSRQEVWVASRTVAHQLARKHLPPDTSASSTEYASQTLGRP